MFLLTFLLVPSVCASPFEYTAQYIQEFKSGIEALKQEASRNVFLEEDFNPELYKNSDEALKDALEYDFIVIGAGASGAVVASRLSEVPEWKVLLLEAGGPETPFTQIPRLGHLLQHTKYNWAYETVPQTNWCQGMIDNKCAIAGGKALGGGTAINGMLFTRGNKKDYDSWSDLGNAGWSYREVLPYFKQYEDADLQQHDPSYHNRGGPFHVENPQHLTEIADQVLEAGKELGIGPVDYNGKEQLGLGLAQINSKHGIRQSTAQAYLVPAENRKNLKVLPFSHVTRILIGEHTKETSGVEYLHEGKLHIAKARKEVVLSAGALNTPQLLMLSGIGPKDELHKFGIPLVKDAHVGHNLKDHPAYFGLDFIYNHTQNTPQESYDEVEDYLKNGKGPLSTTGVQILGYIQTAKSPDTHPDIELFFYEKTLSTNRTLNPFHLRDEIYDSLWKSVECKKALNIGVMLAHPKSTGRVSLKDKDPLHRPLVDPNLFSDPYDLRTLLGGIRKALEISKSTSFQKLGLELNKNQVAGCEGFPWDSDDYWYCAIKHLSISLRHVTGTARMGPIDDKAAVVDNSLKVYGVQKLRVADCSVIPVSITGHTMAAAIMIGEKAADLIKGDWVR